MNKITASILCCLAALFTIPAFSQKADITGLWKGEIYDDTFKVHVPYEIAISMDNGKLTGYSYAAVKNEKGETEIGMKSIRIRQEDSGKIIIDDADMVSSSYGVAPPKHIRKHLELALIVKDSVMTMSGFWTTNRTNKFSSATGTVTLKRKNDNWKEEPLVRKLDTLKLADKLSFVQEEKRRYPVPAKSTAPKLPEKPAAEIAVRKTAAIRTIPFHSDSLTITLYDNGAIDGDTVSIMAGHTLIFSKQGLSDKPVTKILSTKDIADSQQLTLYAENLGSIPPNTGLVLIYDGTKRYEIFFSADLKNNAAIVLKREPLVNQ